MNNLEIRVSGKLAASFINTAIKAIKGAKMESDVPWGPSRNAALMEAAVYHQTASECFGLAIDALRILSGDVIIPVVPTAVCISIGPIV